ncbi:MAG: ATP-dependent RecD-like DNA helicase [Acidobacteriota bacterium]
MQKTVFASEGTGFTVLRVEHAGGLVAVVGVGLSLHDGEEAEFTGAWANDAKYGAQFRATSFHPIAPETRGGIKKFLSSGLLRGVGESTAEKLLHEFGDKVLEVLDHGEMRLAKVPGIGKKRAAMICDSYRAHRGLRDLYVFLHSYGVGSALARRIHEVYQDQAIEKIRENPYRLAMEVRGIGFLTADRLAMALGMDPLSVDRAEAGIVHKLNEAYEDGHLYLPFEMLVKTTEKDLRTTSEAVASAMLRLDTRRRITRDGDAIYLSSMYEIERRVAGSLATLAARTSPERGNRFDMHLRAAKQELGFDLSEDQGGAVRQALENRITAITGGPGTGKTTLVRAITLCAKSLALKFALASPTGRAAKRLAEATGEGAQTLHRLLEFSPESGTFERNGHDPLDADLVIVDESSMIDIMLMGHLLAALPEKASLILVGDADQLASVGAGTVFRDLITCGRIPVVRLAHIYRQAQGSLIVENAHRILAGEIPRAPKGGDDMGQDFFIVEEEFPERMLRMVKTLVKERIPERFKLDPMQDVQVLSPMYRGLVGVSNLNKELQALLNPEGPELKKGEQVFRRDDKVMQLRNDYDKGVYNGDIGRIKYVDGRERAIAVSFDERTVHYEGDELDDLQLAYAASVHKAQGSEYPAVIFVLAREHYVMCQRNLLYTAVTRGKALTVLVASRSSLARAVANDEIKKRYSKLAERLASGSSGPAAPAARTFVDDADQDEPEVGNDDLGDLYDMPFDTDDRTDLDDEM